MGPPPSACNQQPWRFAVVRNPDARRRVVEEAFLPGIKMLWALDAPVHVLIGMETSFLTHRVAASVSGVDYPWVDIGIAGEHLVLAATELGLGTCWIGWIKPKVLGEIAGWPRSVKAVAVTLSDSRVKKNRGQSQHRDASRWTNWSGGCDLHQELPQ